jgi:proteasomal ATPase-associated factor 1
VTSTAIFGVGRNILSSSLDRTVKLWDVPSGETISTMFATSAVLSTSTGQRESPISNAPSDEKEVPEVGSNVVFAGLLDGTFELFDLATKTSAHRSQPPPQPQRLTSIAYSPSHHTLATGSNTGLVSIYDVRSLDTPVSSFVRQDGEVLDLAAFSSGNKSLGLVVATSDGLPYVARVASDGRVQADELIGVDCDPVRNVRVLSGSDIWMSSDDSVVRRYAYLSD